MTNTTTVTINGWKIRGLIPSKLQEIKLSELIEAGRLNPHDIRVTLNIRSAVIVSWKSRTITFWKIYGMEPAFTDSIYSILDNELENPQRPNLQSILQDKTGHRAPIIIEPKEFSITFYRF